MAEVKWIKIATNMFDNRKIKLIEVMPEGDSIIAIWFKLLCLAGTVNDNGSVYFTKDIPYTEEMLASIFNRTLTTVRLAIATFKKFEMIEIVDDFIKVSNWEKYQNIDKLADIREYNRVKQREHRERLKSGNMVLVNDKSKKVNDDVNLDKEEDKEIDINNNILVISDDEKGVFDLWNKLNFVRHRELTEQILSQIRKSLAMYGKNKIFEAMLNYSKVYHDESYFFKYKWSLIEFLKQANAMPEFFNDGVKYLNYCNRKTNKNVKETDSWVDERISNVESDFKEL